MPNYRFSPLIARSIIIVDLLFLIGLLIGGLFINNPSWERSINGAYVFLKVHYKAVILFMLSWALIANYSKLYSFQRTLGFLVSIRRILLHTSIFAIVLFAVSGLKKEDLLSTQLTFMLIGLLLFYLVATRLTSFLFLKSYRKKGKNYRNILIIDCNINTQRLIDLLEERVDYGFKIKKSFNKFNSNISLEIENIKRVMLEDAIYAIYISFGGILSANQINEIVFFAEKHKVKVNFIPASFSDVNQSLKMSYYDTFPVLTIPPQPLENTLNILFKRLFDIAFSILAFVFIFSWLFPILSILIITDGGFPVFFKQKRNGLDGVEFNCLKFRTMVNNKDSDTKTTFKNDPRITPLGKILRKTSLDELPQFWNVLKGEMSIVGPRPHMVAQNKYYDTLINTYTFRHHVKPGITGLAQIKGHRGEIHTQKDMENRVQSDLFYIRNWSFLLDLMIIYNTITKMILGDKNAI